MVWSFGRLRVQPWARPGCPRCRARGDSLSGVYVKPLLRLLQGFAMLQVKPESQWLGQMGARVQQLLDDMTGQDLLQLVVVLEQLGLSDVHPADAAACHQRLGEGATAPAPAAPAAVRPQLCQSPQGKSASVTGVANGKGAQPAPQQQALSKKLQQQDPQQARLQDQHFLPALEAAAGSAGSDSSSHAQAHAVTGSSAAVHDPPDAAAEGVPGRSWHFEQVGSESRTGATCQCR